MSSLCNKVLSIGIPHHAVIIFEVHMYEVDTQSLGIRDDTRASISTTDLIGSMGGLYSSLILNCFLLLIAAAAGCVSF